VVPVRLGRRRGPVGVTRLRRGCLPEVVIRALKVSGYVKGPCPKCGKEERGLVMFDDFAIGWECLACGEVGRADRVEWIDGGTESSTETRHD